MGLVARPGKVVAALKHRRADRQGSRPARPKTNGTRKCRPWHMEVPDNAIRKSRLMDGALALVIEGAGCPTLAYRYSTRAC